MAQMPEGVVVGLRDLVHQQVLRNQEVVVFLACWDSRSVEGRVLGEVQHLQVAAQILVEAAFASGTKKC